MPIAYIDLPPKLTIDTKKRLVSEVADFIHERPSTHSIVLGISNRHSWHANQGEAV